MKNTEQLEFSYQLDLRHCDESTLHCFVCATFECTGCAIGQQIPCRLQLKCVASDTIYDWSYVLLLALRLLQSTCVGSNNDFWQIAHINILNYFLIFYRLLEKNIRYTEN